MNKEINAAFFDKKCKICGSDLQYNVVFYDLYCVNPDCPSNRISYSTNSGV